MGQQVNTEKILATENEQQKKKFPMMIRLKEKKINRVINVNAPIKHTQVKDINFRFMILRRWETER